MKIVVCEPQCWGFEHALFNAALLNTVLLAYPEARVYYLGEAGHLEWVRAYLGRASEECLGRVEWRAIDIPAADYLHWGRFTRYGYRQEQVWFNQVRDLLRRESPRLLVLASITNPGLFVVKRSMLLGLVSLPTLIIPHSILALLLTKHPLKPLLDWMLSFRQVLAFPQPRHLRYIALGGSIYSHLLSASPKLASRFNVLDPPYLWDSGVPPGSHLEPRQPGERVRFGYMGVGYKGFEGFTRLAGAIQPRGLNSEFLLVGFLNTPVDSSLYRGVVQGVSDTPLTPEEYGRRAVSLTYAVWTARPEHYRLAASVSFIDALSFAKPGIYLRNPFIEHYAQKMGDIGYLCDSLDEMQAVMLEILHDFPGQRYQAQRQNILHGRRIFEPETLAPRLREIGRECGV